MTTPTAVTWKASGGQVRVQYVKSRRVLRLAGGHDGTTVSVEVPLDEFCTRLGIDVAQLAPPRRFLLFAGVGSEPGGSFRHVVATFLDEQGARAAFRALRLGHGEPADWAEVASVESSGGLRRLCWFGTPWGPGGRDADPSVLGPRVGRPQERPERSGVARWRPGRRRPAARPRITTQ